LATIFSNGAAGNGKEAIIKLNVIMSRFDEKILTLKWFNAGIVDASSNTTAPSNYSPGHPYRIQVCSSCCMCCKIQLNLLLEPPSPGW